MRQTVDYKEKSIYLLFWKQKESKLHHYKITQFMRKKKST